jgi:hypothetical protein
MSGDLHTIFIHLLAGVLLAALGLLRERLALTLSRRNPRWSGASLVALTVAWIGTAIAAGILTSRSRLPYAAASSVSFLTLLYLLFLFREIRRYRAVGIVGADRDIAHGVDYRRSLALCRNSLSFLGTGASKLTSLPDFEAALARCSPAHPVRLLLLHPTAEELPAAAGRANRPLDEYAGIVRHSLQRIADLRRRRLFNIEVRFHAERDTFRLLFIDHTICLVSFNEMGEGTDAYLPGSQLPQLHLLRAPDQIRASTSFYHAFESYFDRAWSRADPWDFETHLSQL